MGEYENKNSGSLFRRCHQRYEGFELRSPCKADEGMASQIDSKLIDCDFLGGDLDVCVTMEVPDWSTALGLKQVIQVSGVFEEIMFYPVVNLDTIIGTMNKFSGVYKAPGKES